MHLAWKRLQTRVLGDGHRGGRGCTRRLRRERAAGEACRKPHSLRTPPDCTLRSVYGSACSGSDPCSTRRHSQCHQAHLKLDTSHHHVCHGSHGKLSQVPHQVWSPIRVSCLGRCSTTPWHTVNAVLRVKRPLRHHPTPARQHIPNTASNAVACPQAMLSR